MQDGAIVERGITGNVYRSLAINLHEVMQKRDKSISFYSNLKVPTVLDPVLKIENDIEITVPVKPYTLTQLCHFYDVSPKTFKKWLLPFREEMGHNRRTIFTIAQVEIIFIKLGRPYVLR